MAIYQYGVALFATLTALIAAARLQSIIYQRSLLLVGNVANFNQTCRLYIAKSLSPSSLTAILDLIKSRDTPYRNMAE
jgi:hypothetical protein